MIKAECGKITITGTKESIVADCCCVLRSVKEAFTNKLGEEEAERTMDFIFKNYDVSAEALGKQSECTFSVEAIAGILKELFS